jgi:hypothetical protein
MWIVRHIWQPERRLVPAGEWWRVGRAHVLSVDHGAPLSIDGCLSLNGIVRVSNV